MGEVADDMLDGTTCSWCGIYFKESHGYPVLCKSCIVGYDDKKLKELGLQKARIKEL